jgi:hypothetical protein
MESAGGNMSALTMVGVLPLLGLVVFGLLLYLQMRSKKRRLAAIRAELQRKAEPGINPFYDGFYGIMLSDGSCRSGYMIDGPKQTPDASKPAGITPSDS